jgi:hypothetical protein
MKVWDADRESSYAGRRCEKLKKQNCPMAPRGVPVITRFSDRTTQGTGRSATVPNFVPTTKPYGALPVAPKLLRVSPQASDSVQPVARGDSWKRPVALSP